VCRDLQTIYAIFVFVYRACNWPGRRFQEIDSSVDLDSLMSKLYLLFNVKFDAVGLSYNQHLFFEHTLDSRYEKKN
jgi:hypothetical protein